MTAESDKETIERLFAELEKTTDDASSWHTKYLRESKEMQERIAHLNSMAQDSNVLVAAYELLIQTTQVSEWVSTEDREPDCDEMTQFLTCYSWRFLYTKWYCKGEWYSTWGSYMRNEPARRQDITHWMPLPDTPVQTNRRSIDDE